MTTHTILERDAVRTCPALRRGVGWLRRLRLQAWSAVTEAPGSWSAQASNPRGADGRERRSRVRRMCPRSPPHGGRRFVPRCASGAVGSPFEPRASRRTKRPRRSLRRIPPPRPHRGRMLPRALAAQELLSPRYGFTAFALWSHKVSAGSSRTRWWWRCWPISRWRCTAASFALTCSGSASPTPWPRSDCSASRRAGSRRCRRRRAFVEMNAALLVGFVKYSRGRQGRPGLARPSRRAA